MGEVSAFAGGWEDKESVLYANAAQTVQSFVKKIFCYVSNQKDA